ncbi:MAG TPA: formimidoylglutamate deiminase [Acidimicrobiales bacterium]|nr:formimidoylglutamate deiminase [Acidimicrobiales bacterium]
MTTWWAEHAWLGGGSAVDGVLLEEKGGRWSSVTPSVPVPPARAERLRGLTLPGLANGHSHAFHRALRGRTQEGRGTFWTWREQMYRLADQLDPDRYRRLARAVFAEMVLAGFTAVGEFHYLHHGPGGVPYQDPNAMGRALMEAAAAAGIRLTLLDTCYLQGGFGAPLAGAQLRFGDGDPDGWRSRVDQLEEAPGVVLGAAVHSVRAVPPAAVGAVAEWADSRMAPLHAHVSEQRAEHDECIARLGATPLEVMDRAGALGPRFSAVHGTHFSPGDVAALGRAGATCCLCPTTERDLADGVGPGVALLDAGAALSIGTDSHAVIDGFEEARAVELDHRLVAGERGRLDPARLLDAATSAGMASLGWDAGRIEAGRLADLVTISLDTPRTAGCDPRLAATAVFAAAAADVRHVVVGGRTVVRDGVHLVIDRPEAELAAAVREMWA